MFLYILFFLTFMWLAWNKISFQSNQFLGLKLSLAFLALFVGLSDMFGGYDRYIYSEVFDVIADGVRSGRANLAVFHDYEQGYQILNEGIAHITSNRYIFILIVTLLNYFLFYFSFRDYVKGNPFAIMLFLSLFFFFTFTYLRQSLAVSFVWFSFRFILQRRFVPFMLCVYVAYEFHNSALLVLPLYFIPQKKYSSNHVIVFLIICFLLGLTNIFTHIFELFGALSDTQHRVAQYTEGRGVSFRFEYILEGVIFMAFIIKNYDTVGGDKTSILFLNISIAFVATLLLFVNSTSGGRLAWYFLMGVIATMTNIQNVLKGSSGTFFRTSLGLIAFALFVRILLAWEITIYPYKTFLTDGVRPNDPTHARYEYNHRYDNDKFHRPAFDFQIPKFLK